MSELKKKLAEEATTLRHERAEEIVGLVEAFSVKKYLVWGLAIFAIMAGLLFVYQKTSAPSNPVATHSLSKS